MVRIEICDRCMWNAHLNICFGRYWWELVLLTRKLLIMACGLFNTERPERGWYLGSMVVIVALTVQAFAQPFKNSLVDACEMCSLLSTLVIFQAGMVWDVEQRTEDLIKRGSNADLVTQELQSQRALGAALETLSLLLVLGTCLLGVLAQIEAVGKQLHHPDSFSRRELLKNSIHRTRQIARQLYKTGDKEYDISFTNSDGDYGRRYSEGFDDLRWRPKSAYAQPRNSLIWRWNCQGWCCKRLRPHSVLSDQAEVSSTNEKNEQPASARLLELSLRAWLEETISPEIWTEEFAKNLTELVGESPTVSELASLSYKKITLLCRQSVDERWHKEFMANVREAKKVLSECSAGSVHVAVHDMQGLKAKGMLGFMANPYLKVSMVRSTNSNEHIPHTVGNKGRKTKDAFKHFHFESAHISPGSVVDCRIYSEHKLFKDQLLGCCSIQVADMLPQGTGCPTCETCKKSGKQTWAQWRARSASDPRDVPGRWGPRPHPTHCPECAHETWGDDIESKAVDMSLTRHQLFQDKNGERLAQGELLLQCTCNLPKPLEVMLDQLTNSLPQNSVMTWINIWHSQSACEVLASLNDLGLDDLKVLHAFEQRNRNRKQVVRELEKRILLSHIERHTAVRKLQENLRFVRQDTQALAEYLLHGSRLEWMVSCLPSTAGVVSAATL